MILWNEIFFFDVILGRDNNFSFFLNVVLHSEIDSKV